jgi:hypothetical protein
MSSTGTASPKSWPIQESCLRPIVDRVLDERLAELQGAELGRRESVELARFALREREELVDVDADDVVAIQLPKDG